QSIYIMQYYDFWHVTAHFSLDLLLACIPSPCRDNGHPGRHRLPENCSFTFVTL
uniref:Uncharacterized protein n=1 Tax=Astyanax mexicanus TaxID=7994 RepID=A0A8B9R7D0_ASTMX